MKVLVTGGAGFVGRRFCKYFLDRGYDVHCVDNIAQFTGGKFPIDWPLFNPLDYDNFHFYHQDCRQYFDCHQREYFDLVLHLAAFVGGRESIESNPLLVAEDLSVDAMYWKWATTAKPEKTVFFSSSAAYPIEHQKYDNFRLLNEDDIDFSSNIGMPDMTYGWAKLSGEYLSRIAYQKYGLKSVVYRPFSGYGEDQDMNYPFPSICKRALDYYGSEIFYVWGSGRQQRDFIYIDDCVTGVVNTMNLVDDATAINLSTGKFTSFIDFAKIALKLAGKTAEIVGLSDKPEGVFARGGDRTKQDMLGFQYQIEFDVGIKKALDFLQK